MKFKPYKILVLVIIMILVSVPAYAVDEYVTHSIIAEFPVFDEYEYSIWIDGKQVTRNIYGLPFQPFYVDGIMYLPVEDVIGALNKSIVDMRDGFIDVVSNDVVYDIEPNDNLYQNTDDLNDLANKSMFLDVKWVRALIDMDVPISDVVNDEFISDISTIMWTYIAEQIGPIQKLITLIIVATILYSIGKGIYKMKQLSRLENANIEERRERDNQIIELNKEVKRYEQIETFDKHTIDKLNAEVSVLKEMLYGGVTETTDRSDNI